MATLRLHFDLQIIHLVKKAQFQTPPPHTYMVHTLLLGVVADFGFRLSPIAAGFGQLESIDP